MNYIPTGPLLAMMAEPDMISTPPQQIAKVEYISKVVFVERGDGGKSWWDKEYIHLFQEGHIEVWCNSSSIISQSGGQNDMVTRYKHPSGRIIRTERVPNGRSFSYRYYVEIPVPVRGNDGDHKG